MSCSAVRGISGNANTIAAPDIVSSGFIALPDVYENKPLIGLRDIGCASSLRGVAKDDDARGPIARNIERLRTARGWTQTQLAERMGTKQSRVADWEAARYPSLKLDSAIALAKAFEIRIDELIHELDIEYDKIAWRPAHDAPNDEIRTEVDTDDGQIEFVSVPMVAGRIAAGPPLILDELDTAGYIAFPPALLAQLGVTKAKCVRVGRYERSMHPTIRPDDTVLLDCSDARRENPRNGRIYAVNVEEGSTLKRVVLVGGVVTLHSDNLDKSEYPIRTIECDDDTQLRSIIVGEAVWCGTSLL
jgi:transcriptional regulator with XRE-family HTH domain